jgi:ABC-type antimicrobial peptide transport system ATPase subunit
VAAVARLADGVEMKTTTPVVCRIGPTSPFAQRHNKD